MSDSDTELKLKIVESMSRTEEKLIALTEVVHEVKDEQKEIRDRTSEGIIELQQHFDMKISESNEDVMKILNDRHLDKYEVRHEITKGVKASERRMYIKLTVFGSIVSFVYTYFEEITNFITMLKGN